VFSSLLQVDLSQESLLSSLEEVSGLRVAYTKDSVEAVLVAAEDRSLLNLSAGTPVLQVEGVAYTGNGQPIRYTRAVYPSSMFRLIVTNTGDQNTMLRFTDGSPRQ
jgi:DNA-binding GntR family transcriptional regulator